MKLEKSILIILLFSNVCVFCNSNISLTFSQSSVEDWKQGRRERFEFNSTVNSRNEFSIDTFQIELNGRFNLGLVMENGDKVLNGFVRPSRNSAFGEFVIKYPIGWSLNPFISTDVNTQITESFYVAKKPRRTAKFWDPVTIKESAGFGYTYRKKRNYFDSKLGLSLKQVRADAHRAMSDDRTTPKIKEGYKTETGISFDTNARCQLDSNINYSSRLNLFSKFDKLETWTIKFENKFDFKVWKLFAFVFEVNIFYDERQMKKIQYTQSAQIGIVSRF